MCNKSKALFFTKGAKLILNKEEILYEVVPLVLVR